MENLGRQSPPPRHRVPIAASREGCWLTLAFAESRSGGSAGEIVPCGEMDSSTVTRRMAACRSRVQAFNFAPSK
jgi:hypothetical protein